MKNQNFGKLKGKILREGKQVCILSLGTRLRDSLLASEKHSYGLSTTVVDAGLLNQLDELLITQLLEITKFLFQSRKDLLEVFQLKLCLFS